VTGALICSLPSQSKSTSVGPTTSDAMGVNYRSALSRVRECFRLHDSARPARRRSSSTDITRTAMPKTSLNVSCSAPHSPTGDRLVHRLFCAQVAVSLGTELCGASRRGCGQRADLVVRARVHSAVSTLTSHRGVLTSTRRNPLIFLTYSVPGTNPSRSREYRDRQRLPQGMLMPAIFNAYGPDTHRSPDSMPGVHSRKGLQ
jgi:hypothetical protein